MTNEGADNNDVEIWRERPGDYYANSIHVTAGGSIGINVGGLVIVKPLVEWHRLALEAAPAHPPEVGVEAEPVAWVVWMDISGKIRPTDPIFFDEQAARNQQLRYGGEVRPLYAHPPAPASDKITEPQS